MPWIFPIYGKRDGIDQLVHLSFLVQFNIKKNIYILKSFPRLFGVISILENTTENYDGHLVIQYLLVQTSDKTCINAGTTFQVLNFLRVALQQIMQFLCGNFCITKRNVDLCFPRMCIG